jgi:hypothetical protein
VELLEDKANICSQFGQIDAVIMQGGFIHMQFPVLKFFQSVDAPDQSGFSRAARSANHNNLARLNMHIDIFQNMKFTKPLVDTFEFDHCFLYPESVESL